MECPATAFEKRDIKDLIYLVFYFLLMSALIGFTLVDVANVRYRENNEYSFIPLTFHFFLLGVCLYGSMLSSVGPVIFSCKSRPEKLKFMRGSVWFSILASGFFFVIMAICWCQLNYGMEKFMKYQSNIPYVVPYSWGMMTSLALSLIYGYFSVEEIIECIKGKFLKLRVSRWIYILAAFLLVGIAIECWCQVNFELEKAMNSGSTMISMLSGVGYSIPYCLGVTSCLILACVPISENIVANEYSSIGENEDGLAAQDLEV